jgi:hypothetical protein
MGFITDIEIIISHLNDVRVFIDSIPLQNAELISLREKMDKVLDAINALRG